MPARPAHRRAARERRRSRAQIVVTTSYDGLTRQLGAGALDTGLHLTPEAVRRLACDASILPAVLGGTGQPLDVGRQRRLITGPLRRALVLRDRGCAFPGCDRPRWCDAHHIQHWADGATPASNAVLLCGHHHRHLHHGDWAVRLAATATRSSSPRPGSTPTNSPAATTTTGATRHDRASASTVGAADPAEVPEGSWRMTGHIRDGRRRPVLRARRDRRVQAREEAGEVRRYAVRLWRSASSAASSHGAGPAGRGPR